MVRNVITEYMVAHSSTSANLRDHVNQLIKEGWQPIGGITLEGEPSFRCNYLHSMVKYEEEKQNYEFWRSNDH